MRELMKHPDSHRFEIVAATHGAGASTPETDARPTSSIRLDFTDATTFDAALAGVSRVLLVRPPQLADADRYFRPFVEAMKRAGIRQVVFLSLQGVENNPVTPHHKIEKLIVESGLPFTFLRPGFFMQNLSTIHRDEIRLRNELFVPAGNGRTSFVDVRDVGAVAALALASSTAEHLNKGYELTGSESPTYGEVAQLLTDVLGRRITYRNPSILRFIWQKWYKEGTPLGFTLVMVALYTVSKLGKADRLTSETKQLLGRNPTTLFQFVTDYRHVWVP